MFPIDKKEVCNHSIRTTASDSGRLTLHVLPVAIREDGMAMQSSLALTMAGRELGVSLCLEQIMVELARQSL